MSIPPGQNFPAGKAEKQLKLWQQGVKSISGKGRVSSCNQLHYWIVSNYIESGWKGKIYSCSKRYGILIQFKHIDINLLTFIEPENPFPAQLVTIRPHKYDSNHTSGGQPTNVHSCGLRVTHSVSKWILRSPRSPTTFRIIYHTQHPLPRHFVVRAGIR